MAQIVKLRRSSVSGQKPTNSNLQLGELALNTTDGKVFMAVSGSGGPSVQELVSTNTVNTGSIHITDNVTSSFFTGSFIGDGGNLYNIHLSGVTNLITVSGSIDSRLDVLETYSGSYTGSFSGSIDGRGQVDYITFNTSSAPLTAPSYSMWANTVDRTINLQMGNNATLQMGQEMYYPPVVNKSGGDLNDGDLVMINPAGITQGNRLSVVKAVADGTYPADYIVGILTEDVANNQEGFATWFGYVRNVSKTHLQPAGETWAEGEILYPHPTIHCKMTHTLPTAPALKSTIAAITSINGNNVTLLVRPQLRGKLDTLHNVQFTGQSNGDLLSYYNGIWVNGKTLNGDYTVTGSLTITQNLTVLGSSSITYVTSSQLQVATSFISVNVFEPAERFGGIKVYDSGSSNATASLAWDSLNNRWVYQNASGSLYSGGVLLAGPRNSGSLGEEVGLISGRIPKSVGGDHLDNSIISESGNQISITGGLSAYSLTGSLDFGQIINAPTLVSGSSQIDITNTTNYTTFSSSIATTDLNQENRLSIIEGITGSYATTGSNIFKESQTIDGNLFMSGNFRLIYNNDSSTNMLFGQFDGSTIHGPYYQLFGNQYSNISQRGGAEFVYDTRNGGESGFNIASYDGSSWVRKLRVDDLGATITGSLIVTNNITSSIVSSSFIGDGSGLYNLPNVSGGTAKLAYFNTDHSVTSSYFAHITNTGNTLGLGTDGYTIAEPERLVVDNGKSYNIATFQTSKQESYAEVNIKNFGSGSASSADLVLWNNQTTENNTYVNLGINSSNYTDDNVGYNSDGYLFSSDNDLYVGSLSSGSHGHLHLFGGNLWKSSSLSIYNDGTIGINTDKDNNNASTIPSSANGFAVEISGSVKFRNDVVVQGTITAEEIHTSYVTSSVLYQSGSNKFGDTDDDIHQFTGSVQITGSLYLNGQPIGSGKLNSTEFYTYTSSINPRLQSLETESGSIRNEFNVHTSSVNFDLYSLHVESGSMRNTFNTFTSSYRTGSFTGSFVGDGSGLENVPLFISGTDINGNQYSKNFYKLQFDSDTGLNVSESIQGTAFISIGSHFKDIFVDGQPILSATGSDAFEIIAEGGVEVFTSITDTNYNSYTKELKLSTLALSSSLNDRINTITGSLNDLTSEFNTFTSSVVLTSQTSSMTVLSSSFANNALTAAFALNASAGSTTNDGAYKILTQTTPSTTWTFNHQMGQRYPIFQVFDTDGKVIIPTEITTVNSDNATITFSVPTAGKAIASLGVGPGGLSQYFSTSTTWSLAHNLNVDYPLVSVWDNNRNIIIPNKIESIDSNNIKVYLSAPKAGYLNVAKGGHIISGSVNAGNVDFTSTNIISGSSQIRNHGFAITGSNIFVAPQVINSNLTITGTTSIANATLKQCTVTGITTSSAICSLDTGSYNGAFFDYIIKNGINMRAGTIMSAWEGGNVVYNETSTNDLGNTNAVTMSVNISGGNARLFAQVSSGTWSVSTLTRAIGGMETTGAGTNYQISTGYTAPDYCSGLFGTDQSVYGNSNDWLSITRFFTDSSLTTPFNGNNKYYGNSTADYGTTLQIDSSGYVIGSYAC